MIMETNYLDYQKYFSAPELQEKIKNVAKKAGLKVIYAVLLLYYVLQDPNVPTADKAKICGALGYFILPIDLIPDAIPVAGFTDDLTGLVWALRAVWVNITPAIQSKAKAQLRNWFGGFDENDLELW